DAYIQRVKPASVLCLPVQNQGKLSAILYLENQTVAGAFTAERVEVMNMLSAQAAMSIENALLYANLEEKVQERTIELSRTVKQLQQSEAEIKAKNTQILDSIRYAETIQQAILKADEPVVGTVGEYFILFKPRDIVSGDFYWFQDFAEGVLVGIADCTGHGVPGALMSMIGTTLLNQIVVEKGITEPGRILELLHEGIRRALRQGEAGTETQDGMDIALCQINVTHRRLVFAGAKRPLYVVWNDGSFEEIPGNRKPIGGQQREEIRRYQSQELELQSGMMLYMCSDGFTDQPNLERQKYGTKRLRTLLQTVAGIPVEIQHQHIEQALAAHQGSELQRDDITVFGLKISL
ncbi:MAG TPA: SpoIIE family protein phosphatase, partial [Acidobacteriota bacterium]|nr:SpoIIE family protein phosphatase [Acidobacteriota bacterium]